MSLPLANQQHDHNQCIETALQTARQLCQEKGARLTALREQVLKIVWQSHKPLGAYAVMDILAEQDTRRIAPPTVYRALDFLLEHGLVHRINVLNAYMGCSHPGSAHAHNFLICRACDVAIEFETDSLDRALHSSARAYDFEITGQAIELIGLCANCREETDHEAG
ncbi:MAG: zinc uptake transcriptional repressor Zur [Candidatus Pelagadaptatus aseana]|uniref:Fur family transcriptional regulator n=1 Tax=Candidatus Pelagadaptatus aseana TaxID=3120508 RepID=UPI0039B221A2